jgi:hypothetical protein
MTCISQRVSTPLKLHVLARHPPKVKEMIPDEIKQVVKSRYSKFAETGGSKDSC